MPKLFCFLIFVFLTSPALSVEVAGLYQAQAPVESQSEQDRLRLAPELLKQVVVKVVGDREKVNQADISALLTDAQRYIDQYSYQQISSLETQGSPQLALTLEFNASGINNALQRIGLPVWEKNRPEALIWIASHTSGKQFISEADNPVFSYLDRAANKRGIPLLFPLMDLEDQMQLNIQNAISNDITSIRKASERYGTEIIVTAQLIGDEENMQINWLALFADSEESWTSQGSLPQAIQQGIDKIADMLGQRLNVTYSASGESELKLEVNGVQNYQDYNRMMVYLQNLSGVADIQVGSLGKNTLDMTIRFRGEKARFRQLISMGRVLQPDSTDNNGVQYRLLP